MKTTPPTTKSPPLKMSKANFPWSSSRRVQNDETLDHHQQPTLQSEEGRGKQDTSLSNHQLNDTISDDNDNKHKSSTSLVSSTTRRRKKIQAVAVSRIRSVLTALNINKASPSSSFPNLGSCPKVVGTLFGYRKGHVHFVFQREHNSTPVFFIELATQITHLVKEMASGLVRIALECDKQEQEQRQDEKKKVRRKRLLEEQVWRTYCNGKKCGFANKREIGPNEAKILKTVEPISMGAGVLPGFNGSGSGPDGELMYMRAQFERVVGSRDSEAFYMMNPDCHGAPELSIYLLRV